MMNESIAQEKIAKYNTFNKCPRTSRNRTCKPHILTLLVESYGFFTIHHLIMNKTVHYETITCFPVTRHFFLF